MKIDIDGDYGPLNLEDQKSLTQEDKIFVRKKNVKSSVNVGQSLVTN